MRIAACFILVFCINLMASEDASAASRRGSKGKSTSSHGGRTIEPNIKFYENVINSRVGRNASPAAKYFAYLAIQGR
jgi:hypothetical protein